MARTRKKFPWVWDAQYRSPKGKCRSRKGGARKGSIPPDSYDDISFDKQCWMPMKVARHLAEKGWDGYSIRDHLVRKYRIPLRIAREVAEMEIRSRPDDGCLRVFEERLAYWKVIHN